MAAKNVKTILPTRQRFTEAPAGVPANRKVAGYARVSTDHEEQETSYEAQVKYYTDYIKNHDGWDFVSVYTDEGISATNTFHRDGFKSMVQDALDGKIDLIVTKSVSRFARNTVDSLQTIRKLKEYGVEVYFEKENIWTLDSKGELLITIMSSLAQEESRSISENVTWGKRRSFENGKVSVCYSRFLGYDRKPGKEGGLIVNPEQAKTVQLIFRLFLEGYSPAAIAHKLTTLEMKTATGLTRWERSTIVNILSNEKYKGDALLQKKFTVDFLTKKIKKNEGEVASYYIEGDHEAIIPPETFDIVQAELERRKESAKKHSGKSIFSGKIICGECGAAYGPKIWHSNDKYRKVVWRCNEKYGDDRKPCSTPVLTEDEIQKFAVQGLNKAFADKKELLENAEAIREMLLNTSALEEKAAEMEAKENVLAEKAKALINENASVAQDQGEYREKYEAMVGEYKATGELKKHILDEVGQRKARAYAIGHYIKELESADEKILSFHGDMWSSLVDHMTVYSKEDIRLTMKDGTEVKI